VTAEALNTGDVVAAAGSISAQDVGDMMVVVELRGEVDLALEGELSRHRDVIVDLGETTFIDASVVGALIGCRREAEARGAALVLQLGTAEIVQRVLQLTRIEDVIPRVRTREEAVRTLSEHRKA
jgi:anti-anti-sigma factor